MSSTNTTETQSPSAQAQIPAERIFQIDPNGLGGIAQSVNLFRGDVSVPVNVVSLTSRSGVDASLTLTYSSNIGEQVDTWNLEAPTGPVGLGWAMGYEFIARDSALTAEPIEGTCYLVAGGSSNRLFRTAVTADYWEYEAESYLFWRIRYFPAREEWELVEEDGTRRLYGGLSQNIEEGAVQYGIKWAGPDGNWTDATVITSGQAQFANAWNLATIDPPWGDGVRMEYENTVAAIGDGAGLGYTVSSRVKRVIVPMIRTLTFNYQPKLYDGNAREYQPPHVDPNSPSLHAFQDRYESLFLNDVEVRNADDAASAPGALIQRVGFEYALVNMSAANQGDPDYVKRYLTAVTYTTPDGLSMPDMRFTYFNDPSRQLGEAFNRGALQSILYPQGGRIVYDYSRTPLPGTERALPVAAQGTPRVWFGPDYTVLATYQGQQSGLNIRIFSWNGVWVEAPMSYTLSQDIDLDTLEVSPQPEFFALACQTSQARPGLQVLLFHKEKGRYGQWVFEQNFSTLPIQNGKQGLLATGTDFALALASGANLMAKVWDDRTGAWVNASGAFNVAANRDYALAASADYVALATVDTAGQRASLQMWYRDREGTSFKAAKLDNSNLTQVDWQPDSSPQTFWSLGGSFASMTYLNGGDDRTIHYTLKVLQWDDAFDVKTVLDKAFTIDADTQLPYAQCIVSGSVLGNATNLFRFDGQAWQASTLPALGNGNEPPRFVYGNDLAIVSGQSVAAFSAFNPYQPKWNGSVNIPTSQLGIAPTSNGNYVSVDRQVYHRDTANVLQPIYLLDSNLNPASLVNRAPYFIAYEDQSGNTHVLPLANGQVLASEEIVLKNERIHVPGDGAGRSLVGPCSLMTYQGTFDKPTAMKLYKFVKRAIEGQLATYPLQALRIDDGYADNWGGVWAGASKCSRFYYDCDNVTVSPDGNVTEFAAATTVYGAGADGEPVNYPPPTDTVYGRSEYRYHNNRSPRTMGLVPSEAMLTDTAIYYYSYLNGMLFDETDYDAAGTPVERTHNVYEVRTERAPLDDASKRLPLIGGVVRRICSEISQYEQAIDVPAPGLLGAAASGTRVATPATLTQALAARSIHVHATALMVADRTGAHWRLYPNPRDARFLPVSARSGQLIASVPVTRRVYSEFSWQTGLLTADSTDNFNSHGKHETLRREVHYAWQVPAYAELKDLHMWSPVAASIKFWQEEGMPAPGQVQTISVSTLARWTDGGAGSRARWAPRRNFVAASADACDTSKPLSVRFDAWDNGSLPPEDLWRLSGEILRRDAGGSVIEATDAFGKPTATLLNRLGTARLAEFANATLDESLYAGFERYEDLARWTVNGQALPAAWLVSGDAHTGQRSLAIQADRSQALATPLALAGAKRYILSCWVKTGSGFDGDAGKAQWSVVGAGQPLATFDVEGTRGEWAYRHWVIQLHADSAVTLQLVNGKSNPQSRLLLDDVMLSPLVGSADASIYDETYGDAIAGVSLAGETQRTLYDSRRRAAAQVGTAGQTVGATLTGLVRENNPSPGFTFDPTRPNCVTSVQAPGGGAFADLVQGDDWISQWDIANAAAWQVVDGLLVHSAATADTATFKPSAELADYGIRVTVHLPQDAHGQPLRPTLPIGLDIGAALSVRWTPAVGWRLTLAGVTHDLAVRDFAHDWALFAPQDPASGVTSVHFYAGGQLLFAQVGTAPVSGAATLAAGDSGIGFSSIALLRSPRLSASFLDGSGKERQQQSFAGSGAIVSGSLFDPIGRAAIGIKPALAENRGLAYDSDYVLSFDPTTGVMTGRAADAYPDDEGFPYVRTEFFRTAQSLAAKQGAPGKTLAIAYAGSAEAPQDLNAHVQQFVYGTNVQGQFGGDNWPSNEYFVKKIIDPNGDATFELTSQTNETLATLSRTGQGDELAITQYFYDGSSRLVKTMPPAGVNARRAGDPDADRWATTTLYNFLGEGIEIREPNVEVQYTVFGRDSQPRFVAGPAGDDGLTDVCYTKYDEIGRSTEIGVVRMAWDRAALQRIALDDPSWPTGAQAPQVARVLGYDGDGTDPTQIGQLVRSTEYGVDGGKVTQSFLYGRTGVLVGVSQSATAYDATERTVRYSYNALGELTAVTYPSGCEIPTATYRYTALGQVFQVGTPEDAAAIASFSYNPAGQVIRSTVQLSRVKQLITQSTYGPPGWLTNATTSTPAGAVLSESLSYTEGGYQGAAYYDGKIARVDLSDAEGAQRFEYAYDELSRLTRAQRTANGESGVDTALTFDVNGNLQTLQTASSTATYDYAAHSDQVSEVKAGGGVVDSYRYNDEGAVTSAQRRGLTDIAYNTATGMTDAITLGSGHKVIFGYDATNARTVKKLSDAAGQEMSAKQYMRDRSGAPLLEVSRVAGMAENKTQYLYGPGGLIGMQRNGKRYAVVRDHLGSVRSVVDETGAVVARYDYTAYGITATRAGSTQPDILYYRYTGQELDPELSLYNYQARFYDPELGRFIAVDPQRQGASPYVYVLNNPVGLIDPDGEEALTAFLIAVIVSAIIGAVVGAITYAVTHQGNFEVGKFFLYTVVGFAAGAAGGAAAFAGGLMATAALGAIGVSTSTSIGSGIVVGAVAGAADGVVAGSLNQVGVNLVEGRPAGEGVAQAAWMGAAIGAAAGAVMGGVTGAVNYRTANRLTNPTRVISNRPSGQAYANLKGATTHGYTQIGNAATGTTRNDVVALFAHGRPNAQTLKFTDNVFAGAGPGLQRQNVGDVVTALQGGGFNARGIDLSGVCYPGSSGVARTMARDLAVPVRGATGTTYNRFAVVGGIQTNTPYVSTLDSLRGVAFRTYYPSQLRTGWNHLFGY